jgi:hypothetical protein
VLITAVAVPLLRGRVRRNAFFGVRFAESMQSDEAWLAINRYGARRMIEWSGPLIVVGVVSLLLPLESHFALAMTMGLAPLVFVFAPLVQTYRYARRNWRVRPL